MVRLAPMLAVALIVSHVARADPAVPAGLATGAPPTAAPEPEPVHSQRFLGIGAEIGAGTGIGPVLQAGTPQFGLHVAVGIVPIFVFGKEQSTGELTFDVYRAFDLNAALYAMLFKGSSRVDVGVSAGYSGNTVLGNGFNLGVALRYDVGEKLALTIFGGLEIFPDAHDELVAHGYPTTTDPSRPELQGGLNFGLLLFP
jgi:hypothetical protein